MFKVTFFVNVKRRGSTMQTLFKGEYLHDILNFYRHIKLNKLQAMDITVD